MNDLQIVLASTNEHKLHEIQALLENVPVDWILQSELDIPECDETGTTFVENAIQKARHASKLSGLPALADDSGLVIDALDGEPGIFSARYAGQNATDADRIQKVLDKMKGVPKLERTAAFHCVIAFIEHALDPVPIIFHGIWEGSILTEPHGKNGFGYDPIFYVPSSKCSAAELNGFEKNAVSHRGQAMAQLLALFESQDI